MLANIVMDLILVSVIIVGFAIGLKNGFIKTLAKPFKFILSLAIAFWLATAVGTALISPVIYEPIENKISSYLMEKCASITADTVSELPTIIQFAASLCGIDISEVAQNASSEMIIKDIINAVTEPVIDVISIIIAFILVYFVSKIIISLLLSIVNAILDNGVVGIVNRILGSIVSLAFSFVVAWVLASVSDFVLHTPFMQGFPWANEFTGGPVFRLINNLNPIDLLLSF